MRFFLAPKVPKVLSTWFEAYDKRAASPKFGTERRFGDEWQWRRAADWAAGPQTQPERDSLWMPRSPS